MKTWNLKKMLFVLMISLASLTMFSGNGRNKSDSCEKFKIVKHEGCSEVIKYYESGNVEEIGYYSLDKEKTGTWKRFYENGTIQGEAEFKHNKKHGAWKMYDVNGRLVMFIKYKKGHRELICTINENNTLAVK